MIPRSSTGQPRFLSNKRRKVLGPERFRPEGIERLSIAIISRAVRDLLEKGSHSVAAERWLLSREFDRIHNLLG